MILMNIPEINILLGLVKGNKRKDPIILFSQIELVRSRK